jgi:hypothetical protein
MPAALLLPYDGVILLLFDDAAADAAAAVTGVPLTIGLAAHVKGSLLPGVAAAVVVDAACDDVCDVVLNGGSDLRLIRACGIALGISNPSPSIVFLPITPTSDLRGEGTCNIVYVCLSCSVAVCSVITDKLETGAHFAVYTQHVN